MISKRGLKTFLLLLLFVFLIFQFILFWPKDLGVQKTQPVTPTVDGQGSEDIEQAMEGAHLIEVTGERREWELWAEHATSFRTQELWLLNKIKVNFFTNDGGFFLVTGDKGRVFVNTKNMEILGHVVVTSQNGYQFKTELVTYNSEKKQLVGPKKVFVKGPNTQQQKGLRMTGDSMISNLEDSDVEISGHVRSSKIFEKGQRLYIKSDRAVVNGKINKAQFFGQVVMDMDSLHITGPQATFVYSRGTAQVESVKMVGGVKVTDVEKWATSETLEAYFSENKFIFEGNPRVVQEADELRGDKIVFLNGGDQVQVFKAKAKVDQKAMQKSER